MIFDRNSILSGNFPKYFYRKMLQPQTDFLGEQRKILTKSFRYRYSIAGTVPAEFRGKVSLFFEIFIFFSFNYLFFYFCFLIIFSHSVVKPSREVRLIHQNCNFRNGVNSVIGIQTTKKAHIYISPKDTLLKFLNRKGIENF